MTDKQKAFADEYIKCQNATRAAIRAGYSGHSAGAQGYRLLKNAEIKLYIDKKTRKKAAKAEIAADRALPPIDEVYAYWASVMRDPAATEKDKLRASENIAKVQGAFVERVDMAVDADVRTSVAVSDADRALLENLSRRLDGDEGDDGDGDGDDGIDYIDEDDDDDDDDDDDGDG